MNDKANIPFDYKRLEELENEGRKASEELRAAMNKAIARYDLSPDAVLCILARLSAAYIHTIQKASPSTLRDAVEDSFHNMLEAYILANDTKDLGEEMARLKRMKLS